MNYEQLQRQQQKRSQWLIWSKGPFEGRGAEEGGMSGEEEEAEEEAAFVRGSCSDVTTVDVPREHTLDCRAKNAFHGI